MMQSRPVRWREFTVVASVVLGVAGCSPNTRPESFELNVTTVNSERAVTDLGGSGSSTGDLLTAAGDMFDADNKKIGRFDLTAITTTLGDDRENRLQVVELDWDDSHDAVILQTAHDFKRGGSLPDNEVNWAIVGGTGKYDTARGSCTNRFEANTFKWKCLVKQ